MSNLETQQANNGIISHYSVTRNAELIVTPTSREYATLPIDEAFDWHDIVGQAKVSKSLAESALYLVAFRSTLKEGVDTSILLEHDRRAHDAALESPALLHYFGGTPNALGQSLSFCLWTNANDAKLISRDRRHADAVKMIALYQRYSIEKYNVAHASGEVKLLPIGEPVERTM